MIPDGYLMDSKGRLVPERMVQPHERLEDQTVRAIIGHAEALSAQIARFKGHTFEDVAAYLDILAAQYGLTRRGAAGKGNVTLTSYDGSLRVQIAVADQLVFGPGLQVAKQIIDGCLKRWAEDSRVEIQTLVTEAFQVDKAGEVSRERIFGLLRADIDDPEWQQAMAAIRDSIRVAGSKTYIRLQRREIGPHGTGPWTTITIDLASAEVPEHLAASHLKGESAQ
ncbi:MAG: DUF3164 family protein [Thalassobaculales bacterium]